MDHEKQEFYVQFLFVIIEGDRAVERAEPKARGPYPASVLWVPTYQVGAESKQKMTIFDDNVHSNTCAFCRVVAVCCLSVPPLSARRASRHVP